MKNAEVIDKITARVSMKDIIDYIIEQHEIDDQCKPKKNRIPPGL